MALLSLPTLKWIPTKNFSSRNGRKVDLIVVHDCEGNYHGSIDWFQKSSGPKAVSAHLVLKEDGTEVTQMVEFDWKAWHVVQFNSRSVGLELAGFSQKGFADKEWQVAANIVAYLLHHFSLPCQWAKHGVGPGFTSHFDLGAAGGGHVDPTTNPHTWDHFCSLVQSAYALTPPSSWPRMLASAAAPPAHFVPTPTARQD